MPVSIPRTKCCYLAIFLGRKVMVVGKVISYGNDRGAIDAEGKLTSGSSQYVAYPLPLFYPRLRGLTAR